MLPFWAAPSVEGPGGEGFLTEDPLKMMKEKKIANKVPFIAGVLPDEGYFFYISKVEVVFVLPNFVMLICLISVMKKQYKNEGQKLLNEDLDKYLYIAYDIEPEMTVAIDSVKNKYFSDPKLANNTNLITSQMIKVKQRIKKISLFKTMREREVTKVSRLIYS